MTAAQEVIYLFSTVIENISTWILMLKDITYFVKQHLEICKSDEKSIARIKNENWKKNIFPQTQTTIWQNWGSPLVAFDLGLLWRRGVTWSKSYPYPWFKMMTFQLSDQQSNNWAIWTPKAEAYPNTVDKFSLM